MISKSQLKEGMIVRYKTQFVDYYGVVDSVSINYKNRHFTDIRWINHMFHSFEDLHTCEICDNEYSQYWSIPNNGEQNES